MKVLCYDRLPWPDSIFSNIEFFQKKNCVKKNNSLKNATNFFFEKIQYPKRLNRANRGKLRLFFFDICVMSCKKLLEKLFHKIFLKKFTVFRVESIGLKFALPIYLWLNLFMKN